MSAIVLLFGIFFLLLGAVILVNPDTVFAVMRSHSESLGLHVMAVVVRIIVGTALVLSAAESRYPSTLQVIGWFSITAGCILGVIGRPKFKSLIAWSLNLVPSIGRVAGLLAMVAGGFLIHAVT